MKLRTILLCLLLACAAQGQTLKSLMYNTTNGRVTYTNTNTLTFAASNTYNIAAFSHPYSGATLEIVATDENLSAGYDAPSGSIGVGGGQFYIKHGADSGAWARPLLVDSPVGSTALLGGLWLTNTNVTNFRTAIGLGATNAVTFDVVRATYGFRVEQGTNQQVYIGDDVVEMLVPLNIYAADGISFAGSNAALAAAATRTNLGLPLAALTNNSNVTMMRALSGSTNTNHPFSGTVSVVGTNNTNTLVFSNGILQSVQ